MSKKSDQEDLKRLACGYKATPDACWNCAEFKSDRVLPAWMMEYNKKPGVIQYDAETYGVTRNMRCNLHGFKVKRSATCNDWRADDEPKK